MGVGPLHKTVLFKVNNPTALGAGNVDVYTTLVETRGKLKKMSGNRVLSIGELVENNNYELWVRYQAALETNLSVTMKVEIEARTFTVKSWEKVDEKNFYYKIDLSEQRN